MSLSPGTCGPTAPPGPAPCGARLLYLALEFLALFGAVPAIYALGWIPVHMFIPLWLMAGLCLVLLRRDPALPRRRLWDATRLWPRALGLLPVAALATVVLGAAVLLLSPRAFFYFPRHHPWFWLLVMVAYPVVSVYPQELIYRAFLCQRYRDLFPRPWLLTAVSALSFGYLHIVFFNPVAIGLSALGGILFARTYQRTGSLLLACLQHALYGDLVFTIGLGPYFLGGTMRAMGAG